MEEQEFLIDKMNILKWIGHQLGKKHYDGEVIKKNAPFIKLEESVPFWRDEIPNRDKSDFWNGAWKNVDGNFFLYGERGN